MSTAAIWEQLSSRVQAVTGRPLPPPDAAGGPEFEALMAEVKAKDPALFREVLDAATGGVELPAEQEAAREETRQRLLETVTSPFRRPDGLRTGKKRLNTTALLFLVSAALLGLALLSQSERTPVAYRGPSLRSSTPAPTSRATPPSPAPEQRLQTQEPSAPPAAVPPVQEREAAPEAGRIPLAPGPAPESLPLPPAAPTQAGTAVPPPPPAQAASREQEAVLFRSRPPAAQQAAAAAVLYKSRTEGAAAEGRETSRLLFKERAQDEAPRGQQQSAVLYRGGQTPQAGQGQQLPPEAPQEGQPAAPAASLHPGQVFQAKLALPVSVSPAWGPVPALAEVTDGPLAGSLLWGQARMAGDGSVEISFTQVLREGGRPLPFNGLAYDPAAGRPSLTGQVRTVMPNAVQTILSTSLQAASEYFKARVESQSVTITNGFVTIQQREPNFWDVYSRSVAQAMTPRTPQGSGPIVVAHLPKGTQISVIAMSEFSAGKP